MSRAKIPNLRSFQNGLIPLSRASTRTRYSPILGITSWYQGLLRPRSPHWLIKPLTVESRHTLENVLSPIYISESRISFAPLLFSLWWGLLTITLVSSTLKFHQIFFRNLASIVWIVSMSLWREHCSRCLLSLGVVAVSRGVELRGVVVTNPSRQY